MKTIQRLSARSVRRGTHDHRAVVSLSTLHAGQGAVIVAIEGAQDEVVCRRLFDLGFAPGRSVQVVRRSLLGAHAVYRVAGSDIALRREQGSSVLVEA